MIRSDGNVRVFRYEIEELLDHGVQILDGFDLTVAQLGELALIEHFRPAAPQLPTDDRLVEMLEYTVNTTDARPLVLRLVRQRIRIMRLAHVEEVERRLIFRKMHLAYHGPHVVVFRHEAIAIETAVQHGGGVEHGQRNHGIGTVTEIAQQHRQIEAWHKAAELDAARAQTLIELEEILLVIF